MTDTALQSEIARNFDYFQRTLAAFLQTQRGRYALLREGAVVAFFDAPGDADLEGAKRFADCLYSIQQVTDEPVNLGLYAHGIS